METTMSQETELYKNLLKENEAAHYLAVEVATLRRWRWAGKGPRFLKIEGAVRYDPVDLMEFVAASRRHSTADLGTNADAATVSKGVA
jgi:hypothetical protein